MTIGPGSKELNGYPQVATKASVELVLAGGAALVSVSGLVDETFEGFGELGEPKALIIDVSGMTRMTSFGVRQWMHSKETLPRSAVDVYLLGCPTFFVDQLNMVLNFGAPAKVLTVYAPYTCVECGAESSEIVDVVANRSTLTKGGVPEKECSRCHGKLAFDETPEAYFSFVHKYAASAIPEPVARFLASRGLYDAQDTMAEKPPRIIKLVHGSVTYFRIAGVIGSMFRARPLLVGAEGETVIDLAAVDNIEPSGWPEWRRLLKSLAGQVPAITLVDVSEPFLTIARESFTLAKNISVYSVLVPYRCGDCSRTSNESYPLENATFPLDLPEHVCSTCGGATFNESPASLFAPLQSATLQISPASARLIARRDEVLSRALTDANVARAGEGATASLNTDDVILGKYKIVRRLSSGGMAEVFLAKQIGIGGFEKVVAVKRIQHKLLDTRHLAIGMFLNEAKIAGRLMHPNIVQVLDVGEAGGALYLAMEYVHGRDLRYLVKKLRTNRTRMPVGVACHIVREVAQALHYAYWSTDLAGNRLSVVHRDVSPHNIILGFDGTVKLLDFGVALSAVTDQEHQMIVGKWLYMSPEHTLNQRIDHRSDLFSLGVVTYLLCTGKMPFAGAEAKEIVKKIRAGQYEPLDIAAPDLPPGLARLVDRMLASNPDYRPRTGQEVAAALDEVMRAAGTHVSAADIRALLEGVVPDPTTDVPAGVQIVHLSSPDVSMPLPSARPTPTKIDVSVSLARGRETPSIMTSKFDGPTVRDPVLRDPIHWSRVFVAFTFAIVVGVLGIAVYFLVRR